MPYLSLLPWWVRWFPLLAGLAAFPYAWGMAALALRLGRPRPAELPAEPWHERARALFPALSAARLAQGLLPLLLGLAVLLLRGPSSAGPAGWLGPLFATVLGTFAGALATRSFLVSVGEQRSVRAQLRGVASFLLVQWLLPLIALTGAAAGLGLGGPERLALLGVTWVLALVAGLGGGLFLARLLGLARPARPALRAAAQAAARASGCAPRFVWELELAQANALALPWLRAVAVTPRALDRLTPEELEAVLRHELGHLKESLAIRLTRTVVVVVVVSGLLGAPLWAPGLSYYQLVPILLAALVGLLLVRRLALRLEHHADAELGDDHAAYARALERIYADNLVPAVVGTKLKTHPELYDRMVAAGHAPSWPRPQPPPKRRAARRVVVLAAFIPLYAMALVRFMPGDSLAPRSALSAALSGGDAEALFGLARGWLESGRRDEGRALALAVAEVERNRYGRSAASGLLAIGGYCEEANTYALAHGVSTRGRWAEWVREQISRCREMGLSTD